MKTGTGRAIFIFILLFEVLGCYEKYKFDKKTSTLALNEICCKAILSNDADLESFIFRQRDTMNRDTDDQIDNIKKGSKITVPYGTKTEKLSAYFKISVGAILWINDKQISTANGIYTSNSDEINFSESVKFIIRSEDGFKTKNYTITTINDSDTERPQISSDYQVSFTKTFCQGGTIMWPAAIDTGTDSSKLEYLAKKFITANINTEEEFEANGILIPNCSLNSTSCRLENETLGTSFYINVLVKDPAGNKRIYKISDLFKVEAYVDNLDGEIVSCEKNLTFRKCSVPQIWASNGNDCIGTPGKYPYCNSNTNACSNAFDPAILNGNGISDIYSECSKLGNGYRVPTVGELEGLTPTNFSQLFPNQIYLPDLVLDVNYLYWTATTNDPNVYCPFTNTIGCIAFAVAHTQSGTSVTDSGASPTFFGYKTTPRYLRCVKTTVAP